MDKTKKAPFHISYRTEDPSAVILSKAPAHKGESGSNNDYYVVIHSVADKEFKKIHENISELRNFHLSLSQRKKRREQIKIFLNLIFGSFKGKSKDKAEDEQ